MHFIYTLLFSLLTPLILFRLYWRGFKAPAYRQRWRERLALYGDKPHNKHCIWLHAVSVGESEAVFPLVKLIQRHYPNTPLLITTTTPTGSARIQEVLADRVSHVYLPYDIPCVIKTFLKHFKPKIAIMMEKELWPNLFAHCGAQNIPLFIINARLSAHSAHNYKKIPALVQATLSQVTHIFTQTEEDRQQFIAIGMPANKTTVLGNIKFDINIAQALLRQGRLLKQEYFSGRFVWIAASTHKGEETILMKLYQQIKADIPELLLVIVPRHPERFLDVKTLVKKQNLQVIMRSSHNAINLNTDIYITDTMGELKMLYAAADISFIGGSLVPIGGHNILEPLAIGIPVIFGPHMINFQEIAEQVLTYQAAIQCTTQQEIINSIHQLYSNKHFQQQLIKNGKKFLAHNHGTTQRIFTQLSPYFS